jgi:MerR family copper efflux transcriptional regulator
MRIAELSRRTGVSAHRLRRYEAAGLLQAARSDGGYREFSERSIREVIFISMGRDLGFSLKRLAEMLPRYRVGSLTIDQMIDELQRRIAEVDALIDEQRALRQRLVSHIGWFEKRKQAQARRESAATPRFPSTRKASR